ncbi:MAG: tRNA (cytidine(34)-2'-O)-methyltransferase [Sphingomonadaceae bacterium]
MRIALYQPEIAGNVGAVLRLAACFGVAVDIIEPTGFAFSDARMRRAGMDYLDHVDIARHQGWHEFRAAAGGRIILLTTRGTERLHDVAFAPDDTLLMGSESAGVPPDVAHACAARVRIPIMPSVRSLNLAVATGIAISEALRQTGGLAGLQPG